MSEPTPSSCQCPCRCHIEAGNSANDERHSDLRPPVWTPINRFQHQHAFRITQHLAAFSIKRLGQNTLRLLVPEFPISTYAGANEQNIARMAKWWCTLMTELLNQRMKENKEPEMDPDDYNYLNGADGNIME
ncbi:hypothetical protein EV426DRAFT_703053 [Tirmania nivea]|nr:hypothetical protein EV426DRAFT_703053 [Tirmania nivea]